MFIYLTIPNVVVSLNLASWHIFMVPPTSLNWFKKKKRNHSIESKTISHFSSFSAGYDPERVTKTIPTGGCHDPTGKSRQSSRRVYDNPPWNRAPHPNPSRPSWPSTVGPRRKRIQPRSIFSRCGSRSQTPHGVPPVRPRRPPLHRPEPRRAADETRGGYDTAKVLFQPGSGLQPCTHGSYAAATTVWSTHNFSKFNIRLNEFIIVILMYHITGDFRGRWWLKICMHMFWSCEWIGL